MTVELYAGAVVATGRRSYAMTAQSAVQRIKLQRQDGKQGLQNISMASCAMLSSDETVAAFEHALFSGMPRPRAGAFLG